MEFKTKLDYSNNRQIKQYKLTNTQLSGTTTFGISDNLIPENFTGDTINIDALQFIKTRGLIFQNTIPEFTGTTFQTLGRDNDTGKVVSITVDLFTPIEDTSSTLDLSNNIAGNFTSMASANSATTYTTTDVVTGGWAKVLINAASEPTVDGGTSVKTSGATFTSSTDMYMFVWNNGNRTEFYFLVI